MYESLRTPSSPISCSESSVSKLLMPNSSCGLPLHNTPTLLFAEPPLVVQPPLPQSCKYNSLSSNPSSNPCITPLKSSCGTKGDLLTGLTPNNALVGNCDKSNKDQKSGIQSGNKKVEIEPKGFGFGDNHNCSGNKPHQNQPVPPAKPVFPAPSLPLPKVELEHKKSGSKDDHNCGSNKIPQCQPVTPAQPVPVQPVTPAQPATPVVVTGSGYGTIV